MGMLRLLKLRRKFAKKDEVGSILLYKYFLCAHYQDSRQDKLKQRSTFLICGFKVDAAKDVTSESEKDQDAKKVGDHVDGCALFHRFVLSYCSSSGGDFVSLPPLCVLEKAAEAFIDEINSK